MAANEPEAEAAKEMVRRYALTVESLVIEVNSGAGVLLKSLQAVGPRVLGIEPDPVAVARAWAAGIDTLAARFDAAVAERVRKKYGPARLLIARSVAAGSEEFAKLVAAAARCLAADGAIAIHSAGINALIEMRPSPLIPPRRAA
jgi:hypothetical protein